jgi:hypothetical protein
MIEAINRYVELYRKVEDYKLSRSSKLNDSDIDTVNDFYKYRDYLKASGIDVEAITGTTKRWKPFNRQVN